MDKIIFFAVDLQKDFMNKDGKLYVEGAESIKPNLKKLTDIANKYDIITVATFDAHIPDDEELSDTPDFINTFPQHCMENSEGIDFIPEVTNAQSIRYNISKNVFDVFNNTNGYVTDILANLNPDIVVVYGVATNVCVHYAVRGLISRGYKVIVIKDAIKELPNMSLEGIYRAWDEWNVSFETTDNVENFLKWRLNDGR